MTGKDGKLGRAGTDRSKQGLATQKARKEGREYTQRTDKLKRRGVI